MPASKTLIDQAITASLTQDWPKAIELNNGLLEENPADIATLNRLAKAYKEAGLIDQAIATYEKSLLIDRFNDIAKKNIQMLKSNGHAYAPSKKVIDTNFLEVPGKTKTYSLLRVGDQHLIASLQPGEVVSIVPKEHNAVITSQSGQRVGVLPDDVSFTLKKRLQAGTRYQASIKSLNFPKVSVFIREL